MSMIDLLFLVAAAKEKNGPNWQASVVRKFPINAASVVLEAANHKPLTSKDAHKKIIVHGVNTPW